MHYKKIIACLALLLLMMIFNIHQGIGSAQGDAILILPSFDISPSEQQAKTLSENTKKYYRIMHSCVPITNSVAAILSKQGSAGAIFSPILQNSNQVSTLPEPASVSIVQNSHTIVMYNDGAILLGEDESWKKVVKKQVEEAEKKNLVSVLVLDTYSPHLTTKKTNEDKNIKNALACGVNVIIIHNYSDDQFDQIKTIDDNHIIIRLSTSLNKTNPKGYLIEHGDKKITVSEKVFPSLL